MTYAVEEYCCVARKACGKNPSSSVVPAAPGFEKAKKISLNVLKPTKISKDVAQLLSDYCTENCLQNPVEWPFDHFLLKGCSNFNDLHAMLRQCSAVLPGRKCPGAVFFDYFGCGGSNFKLCHTLPQNCCFTSKRAAERCYFSSKARTKRTVSFSKDANTSCCCRFFLMLWYII